MSAMSRVTVTAWLVLSLPLAAAAQTGSSSSGTVLAVVNDTPISSTEVEKPIAQELAKLESQIYDLKKAKLDALIDDQLLASEAAKRSITVAALIEAEVTSKKSSVSDEEVAVYYGANQARLKKDLASWKDQIRAFLNTQKATERRQAYVDQLREQAKIDVRLKAPAVFRVEIPTAGAFSKGLANAPVTLVEYSDFHCPFCKRVQPTIASVLEKYGSKIRIVYKDFPLDSLHPQARAAAEAARCAGEQGKFWEFHDKVYAGDSDATPPTMKLYAQQVGLDVSTFESCVSTRKYQAQVQQDVVEGSKLGVTGTPGFFVNGRFLSGAQPLAAFTKLIDEELALTKP